MYERGNHGHDELPLITSSKKRGLPINIKAKLMKYVKRDMLVPQIVHQMELGTFQLNGVKKKQIRDFLVYQRRVRGLQGSLREVKRFLEGNLLDEGHSCGDYQTFIV